MKTLLLILLLGLTVENITAAQQTEYITELSNIIFDLKGKVAKTTGEMSGLEGEINDIRASWKQEQYRNDNLKKELEERVSRYQVLLSRYDQSVTVIATLSKEIADLKGQQGELAGENANLKSIKTDLEGKIKKSQQYISLLSDSLEKVNQEKSILTAKAAALKQIIKNIYADRNSKPKNAFFVDGGYKFFNKGFSLQGTSGITFGRNEGIFLGANIGYEDYPDESLKFLPVGVSLRAAFTGSGFKIPTIDQDGKLIEYEHSFYFFAEGGYSIVLKKLSESQENGGVFFNIGIGVVKNLGSIVNIQANIGYRIQPSVATNEGLKNINSFCAKCGVFFRVL